MSEITVNKLNESYSFISAPKEVIKAIHDYLKIMRPGAYFEPAVKSGFKSPFEYFSKVHDNGLIVLNGHLQMLSQFGVTTEQLQSDYSKTEIDQFLSTIKDDLPFYPYDFQENAFAESLLNVKQINRMATGSGKSLTISLIAEFLRRRKKKGLLLVPNINLLTQFKNDIKDYNLLELYNDSHVIGGGESEKHFDCTLTISTWQSMLKFKEKLDELDYIITDECLHPDTMIKIPGGEIAIKHIKKGDTVLTINEATNEYEYNTVLKVHKNLSVSKNEKMLKFTMEDGQTIMITGNHKMLTQRGWVRADEITIDDDICSFNKDKEI
jgi:hypothetical protein